MSRRFIAALTRKKTTNDEPSQLARVLTLFDLTGLGVGSTLGLGVYVLAGSVAKNEAGPAVCLSFLIAAIASAFAGLCYAEFASRVPKAGSAYVYSYVSVGEFVAYVIGWNLILEYVIGTASVARGLSNYVDALMNNTMKETLTEMFPIDISFLSPYPDFLSFFLIMILTALLAVGVKESTSFNNMFTTLNLITVAIVLIAGLTKADLQNWNISKEDIPEGVRGGEGGFMPFGISGVMAGAAKCFFGFVGFDCIATTGEEAKYPHKNIPLAIVISLIIIFLCYFGISTVLVLMWPYYLQDADAPFPHVFEEVGWPIIKWIVTIGAIFALCTSLLGAMFPLPRILYAMANDGLLFYSFSKVNKKTKTPLLATIIAGFLAGCMAMIFNLQQLIDMMSIGTLLAYTIVAICVLVLRYEEDVKKQLPGIEIKREANFTRFFLDGFKQIFNLNKLKEPNQTSALITKWCTLIFSVFSLILCSCIIYIGAGLLQTFFSVSLLVLVSLVLIVILLVIYRQPSADAVLAFKVPGVPLIPCLSVLINFYLMLELDLNTWIRFLIWLFIGFLIYFTYSIHHSKESLQKVMNKTQLKTSSKISTLQMNIENKFEKETTKF